MTYKTFFLIIGNVLIPLACLVFAVGFFPYKPFIQGAAEYQLLPHGHPPEPPFDKIIFMVIDALRSDFVFSSDSGFRFTHGLIRDGSALPFTAHASAPTVTMPRIKALTTGSIPSFVDIILNIAESDTSSALTSQDNWISQMIRKPNGRAVMYGDDTWLKLFPNTFARADGTSSFFVSDFTEVDNNVTRHVPAELGNSDWNVMIMHYLGMDHIGHKSGPNSFNMKPKQEEMDAIVRQMFQAIQTQAHLDSTLLVLAGDHGMNEGGNHGGSAPGETSPALVFISPKLKAITSGSPCPTSPSQDFDYYDKVEQSDLAATLAGLLGFPVPLNNLGIVLPQILHMWPKEEDRVQLLLRNALQILDIVRAKYSHPIFHGSLDEIDCQGSLSDELELACLWKEASQALNVDHAQSEPLAASAALLKFCKLAQEILSTTASNFKIEYLTAGIAVASAAVFLCEFYALPVLLPFMSSTGNAFIIGAMLYIVMMFASSYVEEEQQFWYWACSAWIAVLVVRKPQRRWTSAALMLVMLRIARRWNQSGQKYSGADDIAKFFAQRQDWGPTALWALVAAAYVVLTFQTCRSLIEGSRLPPPVAFAMAMTVSASSLAFKTVFTAHDSPELMGEWLSVVIRLAESAPSLVVLARAAFTAMGACVMAGFIAKRTIKTFKSSRIRTCIPYTIFLQLLVLQTRTTSIPLILIFHLQITLMSNLALSESALAVTTIALAKTAYFTTGGTNSISSLDLSLSYNGITSYNPLPVGILLFVSNFGPALLYSIAGAHLSGKANYGKFVSICSLWVAWEAFAVMAGCAWLREHLFVWTVFSPRFLYEAAWALGWHVVGNIGMGALVCWLA